MSNNSKEKEIYFHIGLGKTATTYLQYAFFPKLKGVYYIQRTRYRRYQQIIESSDHEKYFISREFDQQLEEEISRFAQHYPDAQLIMVLRRHDGWMASQYRRHIKNGSPLSFKQFFNVADDSGLWKRHHARYFDMIRVIEKYFSKKPLLLFYEDLRENPYAFFDQIAGLMGASYQKDSISLRSIHTSYNETQLKIMRSASKLLFRKTPVWSNNRLLRWFQRRSRLLLCYMILYPAKLVPKSFLSGSPLIADEDKEEVRNYFAADWQKCKDYAVAIHSKR